MITMTVIPWLIIQEAFIKLMCQISLHANTNVVDYSLSSDVNKCALIVVYYIIGNLVYLPRLANMYFVTYTHKPQQLNIHINILNMQMKHMQITLFRY